MGQQAASYVISHGGSLETAEATWQAIDRGSRPLSRNEFRTVTSLINQLSLFNASDPEHPSPILMTLLSGGRVIVNGGLPGGTYIAQTTGNGVYLALNASLFFPSGAAEMMFTLAHEAGHNTPFVGGSNGLANLYACRFVYLDAYCGNGP